MGLLLISLFELAMYRDKTTIEDTLERSIQMWKNVLTFSAIIGEAGGLIVVNRFNVLLTGTTPNIIRDLREENSLDFAVMYNGICASGIFLAVLFALNLLYLYTKIHLFSTICSIFAIIWAISTIIYLFAGYLKIRQTTTLSLFSKFSNPALLPTIISMIQLVITRPKLVSFVYRNIYIPQSETILTLVLIIVLVYFLASAFCHFSNIYCLIGFQFIIRNPEKIQNKIDCLQRQEDQREDFLRLATKKLDAEAKQCSCVKKFLLGIRYIGIHFKVYIQGRICAVKYLFALFNFRMTKLLGGLLRPSRIKVNCIRFCLLTVIAELLTEDFLLFVYLESSSPCLKFFELISTVCIIPILLSWLMELKSSAQKRKNAESETEKL